MLFDIAIYVGRAESLPNIELTGATSKRFDFDLEHSVQTNHSAESEICVNTLEMICKNFIKQRDFHIPLVTLF